MSLRAAVTLVALGVLAWLHPVAAQPKLPPIVERASAYVDDFVQRFSNVVAEERYVQELAGRGRRRELISDFLLVTPPGLNNWYQFRDVLEVDGKPVRERDDRLAKLFLESPRNALQRAAQISDDGQRYNLDDIGTMDQPLLGIGFLQSFYVTHFRFVVGRIDADSGPTVRVVSFDEWRYPTILKGPANRNIVSHGRFFIDEPTGRVVRTELDLSRRPLPPQVATIFKFDEALQVIVPVEMRSPLGVATYGRFRRFNVQTEEKIR